MNTFDSGQAPPGLRSPLIGPNGWTGVSNMQRGGAEQQAVSKLQRPLVR